MIFSQESDRKKWCQEDGSYRAQVDNDVPEQCQNCDNDWFYISAFGYRCVRCNERTNRRDRRMDNMGDKE